MADDAMRLSEADARRVQFDAAVRGVQRALDALDAEREGALRRTVEALHDVELAAVRLRAAVQLDAGEKVTVG